MSSDYYDRRGRSISMEAYVEHFRDPEYKRVAATTVGRIRVSTIWLGLDHGFAFAGEPRVPVIFETMAFGPRSWSELESRRYATEAAALTGHEEVVALARRRHHGWVKHSRDERRAEMKCAVRLLEKADRSEIEEASLRLWLRRSA